MTMMIAKFLIAFSFLLSSCSPTCRG
ncbi:hypothetical protein OIU78_021620 [Salix suchowensis]|nr:hypothetical protein OIU78_021620 [Salix suchowensis]